MSDATPEPTPEDKVPSNRAIMRGIKDDRDRITQVSDGLVELQALRESLDEWATLLWRRARANSRFQFWGSVLVIASLALNIGSAVVRSLP